MASVFARGLVFAGAVGLGVAGSSVWRSGSAGTAGSSSAGAFGLSASSDSAPTTTSCLKRFRSFATATDGSRPAMTFEDFIVSLCRGQKPASEAEAASASKAASKATTAELKRLFRLFDANGDNVLSYEEFCVLYTLLATPVESFEKAFSMFDKRGDGAVTDKQFAQIVTAMSADPSAKLDFGYKNGLMESLFGADRSRSLKREDFARAVRQLRRELLRTEFNLADTTGKGKMTIGQLRRLVYHRADAEMSAVAAEGNNNGIKSASTPSTSDAVEGGYKTRKGKADARRARAARALATQEASGGPFGSQDDYLMVLDVLHASPKWLRALELYQSAFGTDAVCDRSAFERALKVAGLQCSAKQIDLFFRIFDTDDSGTLEPEELSGIADVRSSFFAKHMPDFSAPKRNKVQQFMYCMQQKE